MSEYTIKALIPDTWAGFARLADKHNGVRGGCWCTYFHPNLPDKLPGAEGSRLQRHQRVIDGQAHAALVFDGEAAVAWAEYGTPKSCRTSTTARSTRPGSNARPTTGSPASSSTGNTAATACPASPCAARST